MGTWSGRWMIHLKDGNTLTDKDCYPHEVDPEAVTSVERVVVGHHLSILKSPLVESFFIGTEAYRKLPVYTSAPAGPPIITARWIGCYLKDSDPIVKCTLAMDPTSKLIILEAYNTKNKRLDGFAPRIQPLQKNAIRKLWTKNMGETMTSGGAVATLYLSIIKEGAVRRVFGTRRGLGCLIGVNGSTRCLAEVRVSGRNIQLNFSPEKS